MRSGIGDRPKRREDQRFLTGQGRYLDDLAFDGVTYAVVLRSPHAHAEIRAIDSAAAKTMPGVLAPAVTTGAAARAPSAPLLSLEVPGNLCFEWHAGDHDAVARAFARAAHVVSLSVDNHRVVTNPMEPRGVIGDYDPASGRYTAHVSAQSLHATRDHAARALGVEPKQLRFIAPDVGGGFGAKNFIYPEQVLIPWAAR